MEFHKNAVESAIRELKKATGRKMVCAGAPKPFWADAIDLEAYVRSNTAHNIFILQGEVPEMVMSGETSNISQFCEFAFYDWIMFRDQPVAFPDDNPVLGHYLGPAINVGPTLITKILKANGEVIYRSTYRTLADVVQANAVHVCRQAEFDLNILDKFTQRQLRMISRILTSPTPWSSTISMMLTMPVGMTNG